MPSGGLPDFSQAAFNDKKSNLIGIEIKWKKKTKPNGKKP